MENIILSKDNNVLHVLLLTYIFLTVLVEDAVVINIGLLQDKDVLHVLALTYIFTKINVKDALVGKNGLPQYKNVNAPLQNHIGMKVLGNVIDALKSIIITITNVTAVLGDSFLVVDTWNVYTALVEM